MRIRHYPANSRTAYYWTDSCVFEIYDSQGNLVLTLSGAELLSLLGNDLARAGIIKELAQRIGSDRRDLYPRRRLLGQHRPLKTLPTSPHRS